MCFQLITNSIKQRGQTLGIQISTRGPKITHLLYADDALIFSHASVDLAKVVKTIVEKFCKWTGQKINVSKSQLLFSKVVSYHMKKKIGRVLGFKVVKEMRYLGVKISLDRIKMADYQDILSNVMHKLNAWSRKSLSLGGKLTLIESSLVSMTNFLITHSMVPKRLLHELEKMCRSFIWHKSDGTKGMHYIAWNDICKPRSLGGLGLHFPLHKIGSLRSKVTWNYIQKPYSLLHRVMKNKYGDNVMNGAQRNINSNAWQILVDGVRNLKMAIRWKVGRGDKISILNDTWLLDRCINCWPTFADCNFLDGMNVQQLVLTNGMWNSAMLQRAFHSDLISLITQIPIEHEEEDQLELMKMCSGKTVCALVYEQMWLNKCNLEDVDYFSWVQNLKMNKKVEIFWCRLGKSAIPTNMFLMNRKFSDNALCARGCQVNETYEHIMVHCKYLIEIIMKMREWGIFIPVFRSLDCCLKELKKISTHNSGIVRVYCSIVYYSWKNQNDIKHGKSALPCSIITANALFLAVSKSSPYLSCWGTNLLSESQNTWYPPPKDWIKINVDASLTSSNLAGIRGVFRGYKGRLISAFGKN
ncbi:hypothetical protein KFK09_014237 [Dendrobium nobile]|uniref:Uncharacterized protein n=1 Tax=Dendrobium nobile TaxID=94219 RepID=A0A8T3B9B6_DENNO|nr:hypothetical protein KFK09_014237 [Dendrobium nobile]